ncbi:hypothetical protein AS888_21895 [Peribacillus simplex]|uniref:Uncharacterized protein n=2 Tax=Peribacillus simplex TaxID=1478 RepID=A0A125QRN6_9BACI|nr:hypothetical protein AS888_21895 [Peribacillus simplex]
MVCAYDTLGEIGLKETNYLGWRCMGHVFMWAIVVGKLARLKQAKAILIVETLKVSLGATRKHDPERLASVAEKMDTTYC